MNMKKIWNGIGRGLDITPTDVSEKHFAFTTGVEE
jgi:hypothetical protein